MFQRYVYVLFLIGQISSSLFCATSAMAQRFETLKQASDPCLLPRLQTMVTLPKEKLSHRFGVELFEQELQFFIEFKKKWLLKRAPEDICQRNNQGKLLQSDLEFLTQPIEVYYKNDLSELDRFYGRYLLVRFVAGKLYNVIIREHKTDLKQLQDALLKESSFLISYCGFQIGTVIVTLENEKAFYRALIKAIYEMDFFQAVIWQEEDSF